MKVVWNAYEIGSVVAIEMQHQHLSNIVSTSFFITVPQHLLLYCLNSLSSDVFLNHYPTYNNPSVLVLPEETNVFNDHKTKKP